MPFLPPSQQRQSTEGKSTEGNKALVYLPSNTTVFTLVQLRRAGQQGLTRTLTAAINRVIKQFNKAC